jgi:hypothetical protein
MVMVRPKPPMMVLVRRPHLSARRRAGTEATTRTMPETPEARKEDSLLVRPACWKRRGAY